VTVWYAFQTEALVSGDLQQEKKGHHKQEHDEEIEVQGPALPGRVLSIGEPPPPPVVDLPGPGDDAGDNDLLATIAPASIELPDIAEPGGGGGSDRSSGGGEGGGGTGGGDSGPSAPSSQ
jgi:hypothetical protein